MAQLITVRLNKSDQQPLGFRLQGGKDFGTPLVVQKVNGGSAAERAGLQAGDAVIRVNNTDVYNLRHQEAQDAIRAAGVALEVTVQRGGGTWRPTVTPTGSLPRPGTRPLGSAPAPVTTTSLKATPQPSRNFGSGHNSVAKPFGYMNGNDSGKGIVNKQYNTPVNMYSDKTIAETLSAQTEVLAGGVLGVNFKKNEKTYDAEKSAVFKVLQEEQNDPEPEASGAPVSPAPVTGLRHVPAPVTKPDAPLNTGGLPPGQNICEECERLITGVFVRIKDKNLHVECFKCSTCGSSLKNQGYYNLNGKLYCDIHAKLVARQNPPASNLEPVTVSPGSRIPTNAYSTPLPPLATNTYTNGSSSMFSPSSNISSSGPKPFGSSLGSAYSPSLSPRSAPMSPARPVAAPAPAPPSVPAPAPAPFAPTQNIKSIVWPPPANPPNDNDDMRNVNTKSDAVNLTQENYTSSFKNESYGLKSEILNNEENCMKIISTEQTAVITSNVSFSTAKMSTATSTSSQSAFMVQSNESGSLQETTSTVQSITKHASSQNESVSVYESQTNPKDFHTFHSTNTLEDAANITIKENTTEESSKLDSYIKTQVKKETSFNEEKCFANMGSEIFNDMNQFVCDVSTKQFVPQSYVNESSTVSDSKHNVEKTNQFALKEEDINKNIPTYSEQALPLAPDAAYSFSSTTEKSCSLSATNKDNICNKPKITSEDRLNKQCEKKVNNSAEQKIKHDNASTHTNIAGETSNIKRDSSRFSNENILRPQMSLNKGNSSPLTSIYVESPPIVRGSLSDALTIAPERSYTPLRFINMSTNNASPSLQQNILLDNQFKKKTADGNELTKLDETPQYIFPENLKAVQYSPEKASKPVPKQVFPPPIPEAFATLSDYSSACETNQSNHDQKTQGKYEMINLKSDHCSETTSSDVNVHGFTSVRTAQNYFEQLDETETSSLSDKPTFCSKVPANMFRSEENSNQIFLQREIASEINAPAMTSKIRAPSQKGQCTRLRKDSVASPTFEPVTDQTTMRSSPVRSRPTTPSLINKPAPIIPHYQMNLVTVEHLAPKSQLYEPSSTDVSRSSTPRLRSQSPGIQTNSLKAHAPRIKGQMYSEETEAPRETFQQANLPTNVKTENDFLKNVTLNLSAQTNQEQFLFDNEPRNTSFESPIQSYDRGNLNLKQNSVFNRNYGQQMQSNVAEYGNTTVHTSKKTYEEFEQMQTSQVIEIKKEGSITSDSYQQIESNIRPSNISKQVFPPPLINLLATHDNLPSNITNATVATANKQTEIYKPTPSNSGANHGPVCDPTPSTGSSVGGAARGKAFGVSSAPKRGRGVLNKAVLPGSRVPLCGSCNGNVRGPFITALGRIWCPEHFICVNATCRRQLQDIGFVEENGQLYCEFCFEQYIAPACDKCHAKIKGDCLNAIGKHFHPECFNCVYCGKLFGNNPFFLEDGLPYCEADWNELFTTKCFACGFPVEAGDRWVEALNNNYHSQCFNCTVCKKNLEGQSFFARGGRPYCRIHAR